MDFRLNCQLTFALVLLVLAVKSIHGNPTYGDPAENEVDVPPMGTCRQECAGYNIGCPPSYVCCQTGCGHICQLNRCPRLKLTPYPFCVTHCPFQGVENMGLKSFCLCYNACMNVRCAKDEMCIPKQPMCDKGTCLPLGVCVNVNKYTEQGLLHLVKGQGVKQHGIIALKDAPANLLTSVGRKRR